ncbi:MAG: anthranilate phosphoribosyltransferase [Alphaproteobacteria bacterium]|nr:anthranilate phosphoribosyltransferase [Alphaproteobacteria bacterium]
MAKGGEPLGTSDTKKLFDAIFTGQLGEDELIAYLSATADRKPTVNELVGAVTSMRHQMLTISAPPGAIDLCGTGGDGLGTLNISTAVSFVVAACGVAVAKHGNRSASSRSGAADVLEALGVNIALAPEAAQSVLAQTGLVFLFAQTYHPAMKHVGTARKQIGRRTIFNLLGPLASPAKVTRQLVGVFSSDWLVPYAEALRALGSSHAFIVHGSDGLDEVSISGPTQVAVLEAGTVTIREITPEDAGLKNWPLADIRGGDAAHNAAAIRRLFDGERGAYRDIVLLNAACALMVAGRAKDVKEGMTVAAQALDTGAARAKLEALAVASNNRPQIAKR